MKLVGTVSDAERRTAASFEEGVREPSRVYTKLLKLRPGYYRLKLKLKDVTSGAVGTEEIEFEAK
jgi:hypothetical protein